MDISRRQMGASVLAGAIAICSATPSDWVTVAHGGVNLNGREYSSEALVIMAKAATGKLVTTPDDAEMGIVKGCRIIGDEVQIHVEWSGARPIGQFVTPTGIGTLVHGGKTVDGSYELISFNVEQGLSGFERASRVLRG